MMHVTVWCGKGIRLAPEQIGRLEFAVNKNKEPGGGAGLGEIESTVFDR